MIFKVLLADDISCMKELYDLLKDQYEIFIPSAAEDILSKPYINASLAVIDSSFGGGFGLFALSRIKEARPCMPVIFTTMNGGEDVCLAAFRLGAREYFRRPFATEEMADSIDHILKTKNDNSARKNILLHRYAGNFMPATHLLLNPNVEKAKIYIDSNYHRRFSLNHVAKVACMSKYHFCRTFKNELNMTCTQYLNMVRISEAKRLLRCSRLSISEICHKTGFNNITYFERVFKRLAGSSPSGYRKNQNEPA